MVWDKWCSGIIKRSACDHGGEIITRTCAQKMRQRPNEQDLECSDDFLAMSYTCSGSLSVKLCTEGLQQELNSGLHPKIRRGYDSGRYRDRFFCALAEKLVIKCALTKDAPKSSEDLENSCSNVLYEVKLCTEGSQNNARQLRQRREK